MRQERKTQEGDYQIWSGVSRPNARGVFVVYWQGIEIGRAAYIYLAHSIIDKHKNNIALKPRGKPTPVSQETSEWIDKLMS